MNTIDKWFGIIAGVAVVNIVFFAPRSPQVIQAVFAGPANLFGTLITNKSGG